MRFAGHSSLLWDSLWVAVLAGDRVYVVFAFSREISRIHLLHIYIAMRIGRMASATRGLRGIIVRPVAVAAAEPLVHASRRAVVGGTDLMARAGRMALRADPLARVPGDFDQALALEYGADWQ